MLINWCWPVNIIYWISCTCLLLSLLNAVEETSWFFKHIFFHFCFVTIFLALCLVGPYNWKRVADDDICIKTLENLFLLLCLWCTTSWLCWGTFPKEILKKANKCLHTRGTSTQTTHLLLLLLFLFCLPPTIFFCFSLSSRLSFAVFLLIFLLLHWSNRALVSGLTQRCVVSLRYNKCQIPVHCICRTFMQTSSCIDALLRLTPTQSYVFLPPWERWKHICVIMLFPL